MSAGKGSTSSPKKKPVQKKAGTASSKRKQLQDELKKLISNIDETGLDFLIKQAKVLLHNQEAVEQAASAGKAAPVSRSAKSPAAGNKASKGSDKHSIDVTEGKDNSYFVLTVNNSRNFFSLEEMRALVKICHAAGGREDGMGRLYTWLKKNRNDVISNTDIDGSSDPALDTIWSYVVKNYTAK